MGVFPLKGQTSFVPANLPDGIYTNLIDDSKAVSAFKSQFSLATGADLKGKTSATLDLNKFIGGFTYWAAAATASNHTITIYLEDENGKNVTQPIKVQFTPAL